MTDHTAKCKIKLAILMNREMFERTIHPDDLRFLLTFAEIINPAPYPEVLDEDYMKHWLAEAEACFTCWETPILSGDILSNAPRLRVVLHGAGTPKAIVSEAVWKQGIRVATAAPVIATDVAETALGAIIFSLKRMKAFDSIMREKRWSSAYNCGKSSPVNDLKPFMKRLNSRLCVGVVGASHVGRELIRLLKPFGVSIKLFDPTISEDKAKALGVALCSLADLMAGSDVVTVHAPKLAATYHIISKEMLALMPDNSLFVNTARGSAVDEAALYEELKTGRIHAYLDVYETEPLEASSGLTELNNVLLSPHISGGHTVNGGFERGGYIINQLFSFHTVGILQDEVVQDMIATMA